jgi:hypothetical protein
MPDPQSWLLLAHAGHWILWVLYALPLIAVVAAIWISSRRSPAKDDSKGGGEV